jgi:hypothetical protein
VAHAGCAALNFVFRGARVAGCPCGSGVAREWAELFQTYPLGPYEKNVLRTWTDRVVKFIHSRVPLRTSREPPLAPYAPPGTTPLERPPLRRAQGHPTAPACARKRPQSLRRAFPNFCKSSRGATASPGVRRITSLHDTRLRVPCGDEGGRPRVPGPIRPELESRSLLPREFTRGVSWERGMNTRSRFDWSLRNPRFIPTRATGKTR